MSTAVADARRLYRQIADQIVRLILGGDFPVGARLPSERDLAERLEVSRPTVREALIALEVEGVVEVRVGAGVYVTARPTPGRTPDPRPAPGPFDVIRARWLVESECAALAAEHANDVQLDRMKTAVMEMREYTDHTPQGIAADQRFHQCIAEASGNAALLLLVQQLWEQRTGPLYTRLESHFVGRSIWRQAVQEHEALLDAIASREPAAARSAMQLHMKNAELRFASGWKVHE
ncbi:FadR/GntR family transcriptional regulator [Ideonella sp. BN130291]|uniref:FadR/GntR family transcriptional regulator n=1 Tax=Ideonella sp. BN130291 TaxID=3112940 RepID=UPI002E261CA2|nr:FadR/GntR family transcriptional regulator [Ideonella sp. BN130291]